MRLLYQTDLFEEDIEIPKKYFNVREIDRNDIVFRELPEIDTFRGSTFLAQRLKWSYDYANCLKWMPALESYLLNSNYYFLPLSRILREINIPDWKYFVRPISPYKDFCGGIFTKDQLEKEAKYLEVNDNIKPTIVCVFAPYQKIVKEYRCIFVNGNYVDMDCYISDGEIRDGGEKLQDSEVKKYAQKIAQDDYFINIFDFVLDIAVLPNGNFKLIEVNSFNSSGFYNCDLDKIYSTWRKSYDCNF